MIYFNTRFTYKGDIVIRKATSKDIIHLTPLQYQAGDNIFNYFFISHKEEILKVMNILADMPNTFVSKDFSWVAEDNNEIKGNITMFPGKMLKIMDENMKKNGKLFFKQFGFFKAIKIPFRGRLAKKIPVIKNDEFYIQFLSVIPKYFGQKIASSLLKFAFKEAKKQGYDKISLIVENDNLYAKKIYEKYGFQVVEKVDLSKKYIKHKIIGFQKMVVSI